MKELIPHINYKIEFVSKFQEGTQFLDPIACHSPCKLNYNEISNDISTYFHKTDASSKSPVTAILVFFCVLCFILFLLFLRKFKNY